MSIANAQTVSIADLSEGRQGKALRRLTFVRTFEDRRRGRQLNGAAIKQLLAEVSAELGWSRPVACASFYKWRKELAVGGPRALVGGKTGPKGRRVAAKAICEAVMLDAIAAAKQTRKVGIAPVATIAYGDKLWSRGDEYTLGDRVDRYIKASGTRVILIDEAQRAVERTGTVVSDKLIDWIKSRHETNSVAFVLLGLGSLRHLFETDRQIERRWDAEIRLVPYRWYLRNGSPDLTGQDDFIALLATFRDLCPVPFAFDVENDEVAFRFFYLSRGLIDGVKKVLLKCARLMRRNGKQVIDFALLKEAAEGAFRLKSNGMQNPFSEDFIPTAPPQLQDDYEIRIAKSRRQPRSDHIARKRLNQTVISQLVK